MKKYIKCILLILLISSWIIFGIKFINYNKITFEISEIYDFNWYKTGIAVYEDDKLFSENNNLTSVRYMNFSFDKVAYCDSMTNDCDEYSYEYKKGKITINSEDYFVPNGTYDIKINDEVLSLSFKDGHNTIIYYFTHPVG